MKINVALFLLLAALPSCGGESVQVAEEPSRALPQAAKRPLVSPEVARLRREYEMAVADLTHARSLLGPAEARVVMLEGRQLSRREAEANAAMKSIVRRDSGDDWKEYVKALAAEDGVEINDDEDLRRYDRKRKGKKVSNKDWESSTDSDSRIMRMKDGRTHLAYKAEHAIDLETDLAMAAEIYFGDESDGTTIIRTARQAQETVRQVMGEERLSDVVADKGYHKAQALADLEAENLRTYIPEREEGYERRWTDKPKEQEAAYRANRRRVLGKRNSRMQRLRSEYTERSFAHICETGGGRRSWLRGHEAVRKRHLALVAGRNLGVIMRRAFGFGTARSMQDLLTYYLVLRNVFWAATSVLKIGKCQNFVYGASSERQDLVCVA